MRNDVMIKTQNVERGAFAVDALRKQHQLSPGRSLLVIQAPTGRGKTTFLEWYKVQTRSAFLEADPDWTASWLMRDIAEELGLPRLHSTEDNKRQIKEAQEHTPRLLILDEADRIVRSARLLETVRGLHDAGIAVVLAGESGIWGNILRKSPRFGDRVSQVVEFADVTAADVAAAAKECADLAISGEVAAFIQRQSAGSFRRAAKIIEELERVCRANTRGASREMVDLALTNLQMHGVRPKKRAAAGGG